MNAAQELRTAIRARTHRGPTTGFAPHFVQANLVVVPSASAADMRDLCARNPVPCALIEELPVGSFEPRSAPGADLRVDLPAYRIYRKGLLLEKRSDVVEAWNDDLVAFLIGCSFTFEHALVEAGIEMRHHSLGCNVPMYRTSVPLMPAGRLFGHMVVSMRPIPAHQVEVVRDITRSFREAHGEPVHWGDPAAIGIRRLDHPDEGDAVPVHRGEVPVFWGCGVTPQLVAIESRLPFVITHEPGHMFVSDLPHSAFRISEVF